MDVIFSPQAFEDYRHWQDTDRVILRRINRLIDDITRGDPYSGIGKPEPLKWRDAWSRRITEEHRLVCQIEAGCLLILQARYHYTD